MKTHEEVSEFMKWYETQPPAIRSVAIVRIIRNVDEGADETKMVYLIEQFARAVFGDCLNALGMRDEAPRTVEDFEAVFREAYFGDLNNVRSSTHSH